jgi:hypothetical protein
MILALPPAWENMADSQYRLIVAESAGFVQKLAEMASTVQLS